ncbi:MAG: glutamate racemase, partial [Candidatus Limnocylindria bacterium]
PLLRGGPQIDTLLLGCTHYPLLRPLIEKIVGDRVAVVDSAFTTSVAVEDLLDALGSRAEPGAAARHRVATTGDVEAFVSVASRLFGAQLPEVEAARIGLAGAVPLD